MSWERDPLWAKAKLYFERGFTFPRGDPQFGFWVCLGSRTTGEVSSRFCKSNPVSST